MSKVNVLKIKKFVYESLDSLKAKDIVTIDISNKSNFAEYLIICTGNSSTHVNSISKSIVENLTKKGFRKIINGVEEDNDWVLIDLFNIVVNIMQSDAREFYSLEKLWSVENALANSQILET